MFRQPPPRPARREGTEGLANPETGPPPQVVSAVDAYGIFVLS